VLKLYSRQQGRRERPRSRDAVRASCYDAGLPARRSTSHAGRRNRADPAADPVVLPDVLQFMQLLWALVHHLQKRSKRMNAELGVTGPQRLVLRVLGLVPGASAGTLAQILHVHPSTLTGVLHRLETQRLLRRVWDTADRRRAILHLTERGQRINRTARGTVEAAVSAALQSVGRRDAAATARALTTITGHLADAAAARRPAARHRRARPAPAAR
jgi:DNA-binding MarR family transcriptional regulator